VVFLNSCERCLAFILKQLQKKLFFRSEIGDRPFGVITYGLRNEHSQTDECTDTHHREPNSPNQLPTVTPVAVWGVWRKFVIVPVVENGEYGGHDQQE
jgi:hypothetical protein